MSQQPPAPAPPPAPSKSEAKSEPEALRDRLLTDIQKFIEQLNLYRKWGLKESDYLPMIFQAQQRIINLSMDTALVLKTPLNIALMKQISFVGYSQIDNFQILKKLQGIRNRVAMFQMKTNYYYLINRIFALQSYIMCIKYHSSIREIFNKSVPKNFLEKVIQSFLKMRATADEAAAAAAATPGGGLFGPDKLSDLVTDSKDLSVQQLIRIINKKAPPSLRGLMTNYAKAYRQYREAFAQTYEIIDKIRDTFSIMTNSVNSLLKRLDVKYESFINELNDDSGFIPLLKDFNLTPKIFENTKASNRKSKINGPTFFDIMKKVQIENKEIDNFVNEVALIKTQATPP